MQFDKQGKGLGHRVHIEFLNIGAALDAFAYLQQSLLLQKLVRLPHHAATSAELNLHFPLAGQPFAGLDLALDDCRLQVQGDVFAGASALDQQPDIR